MIDLIFSTIQLTKRSTSSQFSLLPDTKKSIIQGPALHQFLLILKPELFFSHEELALKRVLETFFYITTKHNVSLGHCAVFNGIYAKRHQVFETNYQTLSSVANQGIRACHKTALEKIQLCFPQEAKDQKILSAFDFLKRVPSLTSKELSKINDAIGTMKIGSGIYLVNLIWDSVRYCILNAFFPQQLDHLTQEGATLLAFEAVSDRPWSELRNEFVGYINPSQSSPDSLRRTFFEKREDLDIASLNIAQNGFHISPGPIEAIFQLENIFGKVCQIQLKTWLKDLGFSLEQIINANPICTNGLPLFEFTEDMSVDSLLNWISLKDSLLSMS